MKKLFLILSFLIIFINIQYNFAQLQGNELIDSLSKEIKFHNNDDTIKVKLLNKLGAELFYTDTKEAEICVKKALNMAVKLKFNFGIAKSYKILGAIYDINGDYDKALEFNDLAMKYYEEIANKDGIAAILCNNGIIYREKGDFDKALENYLKALKIDEQEKNKNGIASDYSNIGNIYFDQKLYDKAQEYDLKAVEIYEENGNQSSLAIAYGNIGNIYHEKNNLDTALGYYLRALKISEKLGNKENISVNLSNIAGIYANKGQYQKALDFNYKSLDISKLINKKQGIAVDLGNIGDIYIKMSYYKDNLGEKILYNLNENQSKSNLLNAITHIKEAAKIAEELGLKANLVGFYSNLSLAYKLLKDYKTSLYYHELYFDVNNGIINQKTKENIARIETRKSSIEKDSKIIIQNLELIKTRNERVALILGFIILLVVASIILSQRIRSERLLLNILPEKIAKRLKRKEYPIADHIDQVTVLFADIVNFTEISVILGADKTVSELNKIFIKLDELVEKNGMEKIKTIGDCYMAVAGIPNIVDNQYEKSANLAKEIIKVFNNYKLKGGIEISFRIGLDCGEVTAGVIGVKKFIYDLWGDTVNTASRMEEYGEPGKIQVTERFKKELEINNTNNGNIFEERGEIEIKGKGKMKTYFLS